MSTWTDDELGDLLRETFHDHEQPDDADRALRIASPLAYPARRHRVPPMLAAVAAGIVVVGGIAGLATYAAHQDWTAGGSSTSGTAAGAAGSVPGTDVARAEARRLLRAVPLPAGSVRHRRPDHLLTTSVRTPDRAKLLNQTARWTVPLSPSAYATFVAAHPPAGLTSRGTARTVIPAQGVGASDGEKVYEQDFDDAGSKGRGAPVLVLLWEATGGGTAVQATAFVVR